MIDKTFEQELKDLEKKSLKRNLSHLSDFHGVNLSSNDYLGLSAEPRVQQAAMLAIRKFGTGGTSSRLLAGTFDLHSQLEEKIAETFAKPASLVFSSGYHVNTGVIPVLAGVGDILFVDRSCHASILDGVKLSDARFATFEHNNLDKLRELLETRRSNYRRAWVITEGIFSMDGDFSSINGLVSLARQFNASVYLDEAHSIGVVGPEGKGWAAHSGVLNEIDVFVGTLSKSLASQGGFVASSKTVIDLLISRCRSFIYTTALAPAAAGAALAALELFPEMEPRRRLILERSATLRSGLAQLGYDTGASQSQIIPILTGDVESTISLSTHLLSQGYFVPSIRPPTVPAGEGRVRLSLNYGAAQKDWPGIVEAFANYPQRPMVQKEKIVSEN